VREIEFPRCAPRAAALIAPALLLWATVAPAESPLDPNRPGQANPPTVIEPGRLQIESGITFARQTEGRPDTDTLTVPEIELRLGLFENVELQLFAEGLVREWRDGSNDRIGGSDLAVDVRAKLWDQAAWRPTLGVDFGVSFPTGSRFATSDGVDVEGELLWAWDFADRWNLTGNLIFGGQTQGADDSTRRFVFGPELSLGLSIAERFGAFVEYYAEVRARRPDEHSVDGGFTFLVNDDLQLDVSAGAGLNDSAPDFFVAAGISWRLPRLWD